LSSIGMHKWSGYRSRRPQAPAADGIIPPRCEGDVYA
jgi:hypothetical protein